MISNSFRERLENLHQFRMNELVAADHVAGLEGIIVTSNAADSAAGFAHDDLSRCEVPRLQIAFPIAVETARGDKGHIERGRAEPAQTRHPGLKFAHLEPRQVEVAAAHMREAAAAHAF